jgi:hypothetical protein
MIVKPMTLAKALTGWRRPEATVVPTPSGSWPVCVTAAEAVRIGLSDGAPTPAGRDGIRWIADNLGMTPAHAPGVISTVERSVTLG